MVRASLAASFTRSVFAPRSRSLHNICAYTSSSSRVRAFESRSLSQERAPPVLNSAERFPRFLQTAAENHSSRPATYKHCLTRDFASISHPPSSMTSSNLQAQREEIEVLESIYGADWATVNPQTGEYVIALNALWSLVVMLPETYPSTDAPVFELRGPSSFDSEAKDEVALRLQEMFQEQIGTPTLFQWIEYLREHLSATEETLDESPASTGAHKAEEEKEEEQWDDEREESEEVSGEQQYEQQQLDESDEEKGSEKTDWRDLPCPEIFHDEPFTDRKSTFQAHVATVHSPGEALRVRWELLQVGKIARATHNILAYRLTLPNGRLVQRSDDDGEHGASERMLHVMRITQVMDVVVIVSRWFGGIKLGPERFKHINNAARNALVKFGYLHEKEPAESKKKKK